MKENLDPNFLAETLYQSKLFHVFIKALDGKYLYSNCGYAQTLGLNRPEDILNKTDYDIAPAASCRLVAETDQKVLKEGPMLLIEDNLLMSTMYEMYEAYLSYKTPALNAKGEVIGVLGFSFNLTDEKLNLLKLYQEKIKFEKLNETANLYLDNLMAYFPEHVYWTDLNGVLMGCNANLASSMGKSREELIGKKFIFHRIEFPKTQEPEQHIVEEEIPLKDGLHHYLSYINPLCDRENHIVGTIGVSIDITQQKKNQLELKAAKEQAELASKIKDEFIINMTHDIRTPFTGIIGLSQHLYDAEEDQHKKQYLSYILTSSEQLLSYINEIVDDLHLTDPQRILANDKTFSLRQLVSHLEGLLLAEAKNKGLTLSLNCNYSIPAELFGKFNYLKQILLNLLSNAMKFTESGEVSLRTLITEKSSEQIKIVFIVEDTGIGIPESEMAHIFDKFARVNNSVKNKIPGNGIGLWMVNELIQKMNGSISVSSQLNHGTTFSCEIPFLIPQVLVSQINSHQDESPNLKRILLVEDNNIAALTGKLLLEKSSPCTVDLAHSGSDAVSLADQHRYDLILMDFGLPDDNGIRVAKCIRQASAKNRDTVIAGLTAAHHDEDFESREETEGVFLQTFIKPLTKALCNQIMSMI